MNLLSVQHHIILLRSSRSPSRLLPRLRVPSISHSMAILDLIFRAHLESSIIITVDSFIYFREEMSSQRDEG